MFLIDSNIIIYASKPQYPELRALILENICAVSVISRIEVLGYHLLRTQDRIILEEFFSAATVFELTPNIVETAILLRQTKNISLGDAVIAATALEHELILVTRNHKDFAHIQGLELREG